MSVLIIKRKFNLITFYKKYRFFINKSEISDLRNNSEKELTIDSGEYMVEFKTDWRGTGPRKIVVKENETKVLLVDPHPVMSGIRIGLLIVFLLALSLEFSEIEVLGVVEIISCMLFILLSLYNLTFGMKRYLVMKELKQSKL